MLPAFAHMGQQGYLLTAYPGVRICVCNPSRPQPFSVKHNSFLQHYTSTGEARILDSHRHVVALNKVCGFV